MDIKIEILQETDLPAQTYELNTQQNPDVSDIVMKNSIPELISI